MIRPLNDNVVLKLEKKENKTASGIILTSKDEQEANIAIVHAVGPGVMEDGKLVKINLEVGERVVYQKYAGTPLTYEDEDYIIISEKDILAVITGGK